METAETVLTLFREAGEINFIRIILILAGAWLLLVMDQRLLPRIARSLTGKIRGHLMALVPTLRLAIIIIAAVMVLSRVIEPTTQNMLALFGFLGVGLGFAIKEYATSLIAGTMALYEMPYRPGDWVTINGVYGEVQSIEFRAVHILTPDDTLVIIPHSRLWDSAIHNANNGTTLLQCVADFYIHPDHDGPTVRRRLQDVALTSPYARLNPNPVVVSSDSPWGTHYKIRAYPIDPDRQFIFITDLSERGNQALKRLEASFVTSPAAYSAAPKSSFSD